MVRAVWQCLPNISVVDVDMNVDVDVATHCCCCCCCTVVTVQLRLPVAAGWLQVGSFQLFELSKEVCPSVVCRRFLLFPFCRLQSAVSSLDTSQSRTQLKTQTKYNKKKIIIKTRKKGGTKQGEPQSSGAFPQKGIGHQRPGKPPRVRNPDGTSLATRTRTGTRHHQPSPSRCYGQVCGHVPI